jgi:FHS family L-fucose permease-like MFS transporter
MLRFVGVIILNFIDPALLLSIYAVLCSLFAILTAMLPGDGGVGALFALFWFESICYPVSISVSR